MRAAQRSGSYRQPASMRDQELERSAIKQCDSYLRKCPPQVYINTHHQ